MHLGVEGYERTLVGQGVMPKDNDNPNDTPSQAAMCWLDADTLQEADTCLTAAFACVGSIHCVVSVHTVSQTCGGVGTCCTSLH